ncbi:MAG: MFS transporter [Gammaproteobacteria bacterium]|nr:MFS transporter [Gammaproteobacteria bacterium]
MQTDTPATRFGPVLLAPGISKLNAWTFLFAAFASIALNTFLSVIMPYVLNTNIGLPTGEQGRVAGDLVFYGELVLISISGLLGAWSDQYGRRVVLVCGLLILGLVYLALGYASTVTQLVAIRMFATIGIAAVTVMITTIQVDYPRAESLGKMVAFAGMSIGVGAIIVGVVFARLPDWYAGMGYAPLEASRLTMITMTGCCVVAALVLRIGLVGGPPPQVREKEPLKLLLAQGIKAARINPKLVLAYGCAFIGRADLVVVGTFYTLWLTQAGIADGMSADEAAKMAGGMFAVVMTSALLWAPVLGWLNDRLDRTLTMSIALLLGLIGYCGMGILGDPLGQWLMPASIVLGIGQMSVTLASNTLIGQEAPAQFRGAVVGTFSIFGAAGILFVTSVGGRMYDGIAPAAPFIMIGLLNGILALWGWWLWRRTR